MSDINNPTLQTNVPTRTTLNIMAIGDSITILNNQDWATSSAMTVATTLPEWSRNWLNYGCWLAGNARMVRNAGVSGQTSRQIANRFHADILSPIQGNSLGNAVSIMCGTNDYASSILPNETLANIEYMVDAALREGVLPIVNTIMPYNNANSTIQAGQRAAVATVNAKIKSYIASKKNVLVFDGYAVMADTNGGYLNYGGAGALSNDGTHPNDLGMIVLGTDFGNFLRILPYAQVRLGGTLNTVNDPFANYSINSLLLNSGALVTTQTSGLPDGCFDASSGGTTTTNFYTEPGNSPSGWTPYWNENGNWLHVNIVTASVGRDTFVNFFNLPYPLKDQSGTYPAPGDVIEISYKLYILNPVNCKVGLSWQNFGVSSAPYTTYSLYQTMPQEMLISYWVQIPNNASGTIQAGGYLSASSYDGINAFSGDLFVARPTFTNLTKLGLIGL